MERRDADVCVIGAGFAGLAAANYLIDQGKKTVVVLEARNRVGGRVWNKTLEKTGTIVSVGGTWLGRDQDRMFNLVGRVGMMPYRQYDGGADQVDPKDPLGLSDHGAEIVLRLDGVNHRFRGMMAPIGVAALANLGLALTRLNEIAASLPLDEPWTAPNARALDAQTLGEWISSSWHAPFDNAKIMLNASMSLLFSTDPSQVSLLGSMVLARGGGKDGFTYYIDSTITETHLVDGGVAEVATRLGHALGDSLRTSTPVRRIVHTGEHVEVVSDTVTVRATYAIVTAPPILAGQIEYDPPLPDDHNLLLHQMPPGVITRFIAVYDTPFWRPKGLSGQTVAPGSPVPVSIDQCSKCPADGSLPKGVLSFYAIGTKAIELAAMDAPARKDLVLSEIALRLGNEAKTPIDYSETDWAAEAWSQGGMIAHFPPGVLTTVGSALHQPSGRIYWAGAERATEMHGLIEGAVRSGERAAADVIRKLG